MREAISSAERQRERITKNPPTVEAVANASVALLGGYQAFRFLADTFGALHATDADLTLSSDGAAGLARMCEQMGGELLDAYGILPLRSAS